MFESLHSDQLISLKINDLCEIPSLGIAQALSRLREVPARTRGKSSLRRRQKRRDRLDRRVEFHAEAAGDHAYVDSAVIPEYRSEVDSRQPATDRVGTRLMGMKVLYDRILRPEKTDGVPSWMLTACFGRFLSPIPDNTPVIDEIDQVIFINLSKGHSAKEIAGILNLSNRTIEHRIDRMKRQTGARNTTNLVALMTTAGFEGAIRYRAD